MKKTMSQCLFGMLLLIFSTLVFSSSPVWKITHGDNHLYLGGTIHVLNESDYPLPQTFENAYSQSDTLVFETDLNKLQSPEYQQALMSEVVYSNGKTLKMVLQPETYQALEEHFAKRGVPIAAINNLKAGMASLTVTTFELQRLGLFGTGVDVYFNARAVKDKKTLAGLETVEQQLNFIKNLGEGYEDQLIKYTLSDVEELPNIMKALKEAWRKGDNGQLEKMALIPIKKEFPKIYKTFIVNRNQAWLKKIKDMLDTPEVEFILFGALHMVGQEGILEQLESEGYDVVMQ